MAAGGWVYILASQPRGTLYIGVRNDLTRSIYEHREGLVPGFTKKCGVKLLVWNRRFDTIQSAIGEEKRLKAWKRQWKIGLVEQVNPEWNDQYEEIVGLAPS